MKALRSDLKQQCIDKLGEWSEEVYENYNTRLSFALLKAFKHTLMIRRVVGHYSSVTDTDEWNVSSSSVTKLRPRFIVAPEKMIRMMPTGTNSDWGVEMPTDMVMWVPEQFLLPEHLHAMLVEQATSMPLGPQIWCGFVRVLCVKCSFPPPWVWNEEPLFSRF